MGSELSLNKLNLQLLGALGVVALLLAVIGVYGVTAHAVRQRTREIAIRLTLGLTPAAVKRLLLRECALLMRCRIRRRRGGRRLERGRAAVAGVRHHEHQSGDVRDGGRGAGRRRAAGLLHPGPPRGPRRSGDVF